MAGDDARPGWAVEALDEVLDPVVVAHPVHDGARIADFVLDYANPAARAWGAAPGVQVDAGLGLRRAPRFSAYVEAYSSGRQVSLSAVPSRLRSEPVRFVDLRITRVADRLVLTWRDVTDRVQAEQAAAAAEARFEAVLENHPDPSLLARPVLDDADDPVDLRVWFVNRAARQWGGQPGLLLREPMVALGADELFEAYLEVARGGPPVALDGVHLAEPDGARVVDVRAARVAGAIVATWRDSTAKHRAEQALVESEARFRMAFDDAPVGMAIADVAPGGRYVQVNAAFAAMLGRTPDEMVGHLGAEFTHPDDVELDSATLRRFVEGERAPFQREKRMLHADGSVVWVRKSSAPAAVHGHPTYVITHVQDITERRAVEAELERRALHDPLTGLANRSLLLDHLGVLARGLDRAGGHLAVLYLDLDRFKDINDTLGHAAGDEVLREVARRIGAVLRADATAARLAGDEFVVATRVSDDLAAVRIAERLHAAVLEPLRVSGRELVVRPSIGVAVSDDGATQAEELLRHADVAMYHAKHHSSEPWALYDDELHAIAVNRLAIEEDLRAGLARARFRLLYQPIRDLDSGRVVSAEALLRLEHPQHGTLTPAAFLDVAEDSRLILPIGAWVLDEAARQLALWRRRRPDLTVSVNVSPRQVHHLVLRDQVVHAAQAADVDPAGLQLEITERVLLGAGDDVLAELLGVTGAGCGLAIDDFGTGYSSLAYLTRFPVSEVKIDRAFVAGLGGRGRDTAVAEAILGLAGSLGLGAVAEGVETSEQLEALRALGCPRAQGFHLGRPMSAEDLGALLD
ncbi:EAL domain-containing protein [Isoptericola sp. b441]|uniref:EAL domain-containing protein n=1 Tax=Actinotalea lenta TaxID=3064654 RepID=A0ABT9D933_9CELL|nr:EAL domain-containing protein [Isoptericola sp. b441]MDO8105806.1 EAL domain-containing protein [Isoptericola sp. b441]